MKAKRLIYGIGNNNADYAVVKREAIDYADGKRKWKQVWMCKYYSAWASMLKRCYSAKFQEKRPTYKDCTVSEDWLTFSVFRNWMMKQDWQGKSLDKDLLIENNKIYSADNCVFVSPMVNTFINDQRPSRGEWMTGVCWHKPAEKFQASCRNPFSGKQEHLGLFTTEIEAHGAWRKRKLELAHELAAIQTDPRVAKALVERYSKPQEHLA